MRIIGILFFSLFALSVSAEVRNGHAASEMCPLKVCTSAEETGLSVLDDRVAFSRGGQVFVGLSDRSWNANDFVLRKDLQLLEIEGQFSQYYSLLYFSSYGRLYCATLKNGEWGSVEELHIQGYGEEKTLYQGSSFAYRRWIYRKRGRSKEGMFNPAVAMKGKRLYFVSEMEGGKGGKDIWYMDWDSFQNRWSAPVNAEEFNTEYNEDFPFVSADTVFYFSSDRPSKSKGNNLYKMVLTDDVPVIRPFSGAYCSNFDDYNFIVAGGKNFFISTRKGIADVYTMQHIEDEDDVLEDHKANVVRKDEKTVVLYFQSNKTNMVNDYDYEFSVIYDFISSDQNSKYKIIGYADERGTEANNVSLSRDRAKVVYDQLVKMGISKQKISYEGAGSTNPVVKNAKSESDHQKNRRVEIVKQ